MGWKPWGDARRYDEDFRLSQKLHAYFEEISGEGINISVEFYVEPEIIRVHTRITAPRKGDQALVLLAEKLQRLANVFKRPFVHVGVPTNTTAEKLFARTPSYRLLEDGETWVRTFEPESKNNDQPPSV